MVSVRDRATALVALGYQPGQNPSIEQLRARHGSLVKEVHPDGSRPNRDRFELVTLAYEFLKCPPLSESDRAKFERELAGLKQQMIDWKAGTKLWSPDDPRLKDFSEPKEARIAELEKILKGR